jgi:phage protein D
MGEMTLSPLAYYSARPTLRVDGQDEESVATLLQSMLMHEQEGGLSSVELAFVDWGLRPDGSVGPVLDDERVLKLGAQVQVYAGEAAAPTEIFKGRIGALEYAFDTQGAPRLIVHAEDGAMRARLTRRSEVYENQSLADIVRTVAQRLALTPRVTGLAASRTVEVQCNESDLAFLRRLLARQGGDLQVVGDELQVAPRQEVQRGTVELTQGSQLHRLRVVADLADQVTEVEVTGFDASAGQAVTGTCSDTAFGPGSGRNGPGLLRATLGERRQHSAHRVACTQAEADALARAEIERRARRFVQVEGACEGNPALRVGTHLRLQGAGPRWSNTYYVTACTHRYDMRAGYETQFRAEGAYLGNP